MLTAKIGLAIRCFGLFAPVSIFLGLSLLTLPATAQTNSALAYTFTTLAGEAGVGSADGVGDAAQFSNPYGIAVDSAGNLYVADTFNFTISKDHVGRGSEHPRRFCWESRYKQWNGKQRSL